MSDQQREIGARIAAARREAGLTQHALAERLGVTTRSVQNYEAGVSIPYKHLRRIETLARKRPGWILASEPANQTLAETIEQLEAVMERHYSLLQEHLNTLHRQVELLRERREAVRFRRRTGGGDQS
jgi:transcriptional regulator with XRE-family HTH domain